MTHALIVRTELDDQPVPDLIALTVTAQDLRDLLQVMNDVTTRPNCFYIVQRAQVWLPGPPGDAAFAGRTWALIPEDDALDGPQIPTLDLKRAEVLRGSVLLRANLNGTSRVVTGELTRADLTAALAILTGAPTPDGPHLSP